MILDWLTSKPAAPPANAWVASRVQALRIEALLGWFERRVPEIWRFDIDPYGDWRNRLRYPHPSFSNDDELTATWRRYRSSKREFEPEPLLEGLTDVLLYPGAWTETRPRYTDERRRTLEAVTRAVAARRSFTSPTTCTLSTGSPLASRTWCVIRRTA